MREKTVKLKLREIQTQIKESGAKQVKANQTQISKADGQQAFHIH